MKISAWINKIACTKSLRLKFAAFIGTALFLAAALPVHGQLKWAADTVSTNLALTASSVQVEFCFTNAGATTVHVGKTYSTCGCTTVLEWPSRTVPPGAAGKIIVKIDVLKGTGTLRKTVYLDTETSTYVLNAIIKIPDLITFSPQTLDYQRTNIVAQSIVFSNLLEGPIRVKSVAYDCESAKAVHYSVKTIDPGRVFALEIKPSPSNEPYNIRFVALVQQLGTNVEKNYYFEANVN